MIRALFGLIMGTVVVTAGAVAYGKSQQMHAWEVEPYLLIALGSGAAIGLILGLISHARRRRTA